ncbi:integrase core domain-containing protein [Poseidonocella sp. HB161398]|uniref:integrase core domain-containing protein n=1 Tax=Poseidonocella sp. HB161398 TaxID=2320855 RepID=UPI00110892CE
MPFDLAAVLRVKEGIGGQPCSVVADHHAGTAALDRAGQAGPERLCREHQRRSPLGSNQWRLNGSLSDECLNLRWFRPFLHASEKVGRGRDDCNSGRPHSAPGYLSPPRSQMKTAPAASETHAVPPLPLNPNRRIAVQNGPDEGGGSG